jgi:alpha-galactosidase
MAENILRDADMVRAAAPAGSVKPFAVIDDGYQDPSRFPSMPRLAEEIRRRGVVPGVWVRPLKAGPAAPQNLLLPEARWSGARNKTGPAAYDPTIPEGLAAAAAVAKSACDWGFDLIKHDFTTFELLGLWGSEMVASPTQGAWHFNDRSLTNAEVVTKLYRELRVSCGEDRLILGCNTIGHLSVGLFDLSRTGDDVSGRNWERTRRTGVNTLAFRLPQHKVFFGLDADCVPITAGIPWAMSQQWLEAVSESGTVLLVSAERDALGKEQLQAVKEAFARCAQRPEAEPADWLSTRTPAIWQTGSKAKHYEWTLAEGETPFPIGIQQSSI